MNNLWTVPPDFRIESDYISKRDMEQVVDWGLIERRQPDFWGRSQGEGVLVIVLDTINNHGHEDLPKPFYSKDYANSSNRNMHGWHVAGIVAAKNNETGVVGWAPKATLGLVSVLGDSGSGTSAGIRKAVLDIIQLWKSGWHKDFWGCILNMSLGGPGSLEDKRVYDQAAEAGIIVSTAAGNSGPGGVDSPANYDSTIAVASYRKDGRLSDFSSRGPEVDFAAAGENIYSTVPNNKYGKASGTSMACPAFSGMCANIISSRPYQSDIKTVDGLRNFVKTSVEDRGPEGRDPGFGEGIPILEDLVRSKKDWYF